MKTNFIGILITLLLFFGLNKSAFPKEPWAEYVVQGSFDPIAAALFVPPFCEGNSGIGIIHKPKDWKKIYGQDFTYINHYCDGKHKIPKCYEYPEKEKKACLRYFLEGTTYAIKNSHNQNYALLPFLHTERGNLLKDIGNYEEAILEFKTSISKNNKFHPAYLGIADTYIKLKDLDEAEKYIQMGLEHNPDKKSLNKKLERIRKLKK